MIAVLTSSIPAHTLTIHYKQCIVMLLKQKGKSMTTKTSVPLNEALQFMLETANAVGEKTGHSPVELLVYGAAHALAPHFNRKDAAAQMTEARTNLVKAGLEEKK